MLNLLKCFLFHAVPRLQRLPPAAFRRILVVRNDRVGDLCLTLPFPAACRALFPGAEITMLVSAYAADIVTGNPAVDRVVMQERDETPRSVAERIPPCDTAFILCSTRFNARLARLLRASYVVGYAWKPYNMLSCNRFSFVRRSAPPVHETDFCLLFLDAVGADTRHVRDRAAGEARIHVPLGVRAAVDDLLADLGVSPARPLVAVHPGDKRSAPNVGIETYGRLGREILERLDRRGGRLLYVFGPGEESLWNRLPGDVRERCAAVRGTLSLKELCALLGRADCLVSGSTGPMHVAALVGTPTVSFFSPHRAHDPRKWHPLGKKYVILMPPVAEGGTDDVMQAVDTAAAADAVMRVLEEASSSRGERGEGLVE